MNNNTKEFTIKETDNKTRLDVFVASSLSISRAQAQKLILRQAVLVNGAKKDKNHQLKTGETVTISQTDDKKPAPNDTENNKLDIIFENNDYLVVNKPSGLLVHADNSHTSEMSLADIAVSLFPEIASVGDDPARPGIVHRLDKPVSGVIVIARTQEMFEHIKQQFKSRSVKKQYIALVHGNVILDSYTIDYTISRKKSGFMAAHTDRILGKEAETEISVITRYPTSTLISAFPKTGRTHQIRAHMLAYGHPIVGDPIYSNAKSKRTKIDRDMQRIFLHSHSIGFKDLEGEFRSFESPLDPVLRETLQIMDTKHQKWLYMNRS